MMLKIVMLLSSLSILRVRNISLSVEPLVVTVLCFKPTKCNQNAFHRLERISKASRRNTEGRRGKEINKTTIYV